MVRKTRRGPLVNEPFPLAHADLVGVLGGAEEALPHLGLPLIIHLLPEALSGCSVLYGFGEFLSMGGVERQARGLDGALRGTGTFAES